MAGELTSFWLARGRGVVGRPSISVAQRANAQKIINAKLAYTPRTVMSTPPTLSNSNDATTIGSTNNGASANSIMLTDATKIKGTGPFALKNTGAPFLGIKGQWSQYGASDLNAGGSGWGFAFNLTGSVFELAISLSTARRIRMRVNGQWASATHWSPSNFGSPTVPDDFCVLKFTFGSSATRLIELFFGFDFGANGAWVNIASGASITLPVDGANEPFTRVWGDSFVEAPYVENTGYDTRETTPQALCELMGVRDAAMAGRSAQGFTNPVDGQTFPTRITANVGLLTTRAHEIIEGTINDNANGNFAAVQAAVTQAIVNLRAGAPDACITVTGPFTFDANPTPAGIYNAHKQGALAAMATDPAVIFIETNDLPSINNGGLLPNGQTQQSFDGVHPGKNWSNYVAPFLADRIVSAWQAKIST